MIEVIDVESCTGCNICVEVCPTNVFDAGARFPVIARVHDCQTCFMCEAWCPEDALYVSPQADVLEHPDLHAIRERGLIGSYRAAIGGSKSSEAASG